MSSILLPQPPTLPEGYCPESWQQVFDDIAHDFDWTINGTPGVVISEDAPSDITALWVRLVDGFPEDNYVYVGEVGMWLSPYYPSADSRWIYWWYGSESDLWGMDGGDGVDPSAVSPTIVTGSFWKVFTTLAGRMPVGAGTLQPSGTMISVGDTGGEDEHVLTEGELAEHSHAVETGPTTSGDDGGPAITSGSSPAHPSIVLQDSPAGSDEPHNNMPPYLALHGIQRTARKYKTAT